MICPDPDTCTVDQSLPQGPVSTAVLTRAVWYNVSRHPGIFNRSGRGDSRFSPLFDGDSNVIPHTYIAQNHVSALLETALHDTWGDENLVERSDLEGLTLRAVAPQVDHLLFDIRDVQLPQYGLDRENLVSCSSAHYPCTRDWARTRAQMQVDGHSTSGFIWNSRQAEIAAAHADAPMRVLLTVAEQSGHIAVVYDHDNAGDAVFDQEVIYEDLSRGDGFDFVRQTATLVGLAVAV
ncbi:RES domain-containing protein [Candidatus Poriferisodalis sp.]|uniref:RES domain-containing protein n=1 Tax=Candidatus Poriferisodalis sp. TaxID=3101277 RepID=UPI003B02037E